MTIEEKVLNHLKKGHEITQYEAIIEYGALRLSAVIHNLRKKGHNIETNMVKRPNGKHVAQYSLVGVGFDG